MKHLIEALIALTAVAPTASWAQEPAAESSDTAAEVQAVPPGAQPTVPPTQAAPEQVPVPSATATADSTQQAAAEVQPPSPPPGVPAGQWVYTTQYGWVWMPYGQSYTYVPDDGDPYMYVYYPSYGWNWVVAPWVLGWGPTPYWGTWGVRHFAWHSHPWFHGRVDHGFHSGRFGAPHFQAGTHGAFVPHSGGVRHFGGSIHVAPNPGHAGGGWGGHPGGAHVGGGHGGFGHFGGGPSGGGHFGGGGHGGGGHGGGGHGGGGHGGGHR